MSHGEIPPAHEKLETFPETIGSWNMTQQGVVEEEVQKVLKADDTLSRTYGSPKYVGGANLFVAYFESQRTGKAPHSPKNCLPGSGWVPTASGTIQVNVAGRTQPIEVNRYVVSKGNSRSLVIYWYQTSHRVIASEYMAKVYLVTDAIRYNRTDTSLVRVVVPVNEQGEKQAEETAVDFVQAAFPVIGKWFRI